MLLFRNNASARLLFQQIKNTGILSKKTNFLMPVMANSTYAKPFEPVSSYSSHWKSERIYSVLTLPLAPAAYFFHGTTMDYILTAVVVLHMHL